MIPEKLKIRGVNFCLIAKGEKKPFEKEWQIKKMEFDDAKLIEHINKGGSYGVRGGGDARLVIVDFDREDVQTELVNKLPPTFTVKTGRGLLHKYFFSDDTKNFKIFTENLDTILDVQGETKQVVGVGSVHANGNKYELIDDIAIAFIPYAELKAIIMPYDKRPKKEEVQIEKPVEYSHDNFLDLVKSRVSIESVLSDFGVDTSRNPTTCPFHNSNGGKCLGFKGETAHCFHCDGSWNIYSLVKEYKRLDFKDALLWIVDRFGLQKEHEESRKQYLTYLNSNEANEKKDLQSLFLENIKDEKIGAATELIVNYILKNNYIYTTKDDIKSEVWIYKEGIYIPQGRSEIKVILRDILEQWFNIYYFNQVISKIEVDTYIEQDKFFSINYKDELPVENGILNIFTKELKPFNPNKIFFNKLPVKYNAEARCINIDLFLNQVLATEEDKKVFYEYTGSGLLKEYRFEKALMMVGNGRNGKGKSLELLKRLFGPNNCFSLSLSALQHDNADVSQLFGKMLNLAGDIGFQDLKETQLFKSLTGRDLITTKRKFLSALTFENYAKFIFACNELPNVYDTSKGFWDRWLLLNYPYTFVTQEEYDKASDKTNLKIKDSDIINKIITPGELSGFLNATLDGLDRLITNKDFSSTMGSEQIKQVWMRKANSFIAFALDYLEPDYDGIITKKELRRRYHNFTKLHKLTNKSDFVVKRVLQEEFGASEDRKLIGVYPDNEQEYVWQGIKWRK